MSGAKCEVFSCFLSTTLSLLSVTCNPYITERAMSVLRNRKGGKVEAGETDDKSPLNTDNEPVPLISREENECRRSKIARLWFDSRRLTEAETDSGKASFNGMRGKGENRPVTLANVIAAFSLIQLTVPRFLAIFWHDQKWPMIIWFAGKMIQASLPAGR